MTTLLSKEAAPATGNTGIPGRQSASSILTSPGLPPARIQVVLDEMKTAPGPTWGEHPQNLAIWHAYGPPLQNAFDGVTDVQSAVAATQQAVATAMKKPG